MSITKSFNKKMNTYYVYDTEYVWSEAKQRKVQKRQCIGKWDEKTGKIIPTGARGRRKEDANLADSATAETVGSSNEQLSILFAQTASDFNIITAALSDLSSKYQTLSNALKQPILDSGEENHE